MCFHVFIGYFCMSHSNHIDNSCHGVVNVLTSGSSMDYETMSVTDLETKLTRSMIHYYLQIADSARLQVTTV